MPKNTQKCKGYEIFQRLNYLFQIRDLMAGNPMVSNYYGNLIVNIAKKSVLRIDPGLKRQICKKCRGPLLPNQTVHIKVKKKNKCTTVLWKCKLCNYTKNYSLSSKHKLWCERNEAVVDILDYGKLKSLSQQAGPVSQDNCTLKNKKSRLKNVEKEADVTQDQK